MGGTLSAATATPPPSTPSPARGVWVSPTGDDAAAGTGDAPLRTLHQAQQEARRLRSVQPGPVSIVLAPGRYELARPLEFDAADGDAVWSGAAAGQVRISGGALVGPWQREGSADRVQLWRSPALPDPAVPLWRAALPAGATANQLWVCGERAVRARHPNGAGMLRWERPLATPFGAWGLVYEAGQGLEAMGQALVGSEAVAFHSWTASRHTVAAHLPLQRTLLFAQPSHAALGAHLRQSGRRFYLEHSLAFLDAPGEWVRADNATLLYAAAQAPDAAGCEVVASRGLEALLHVSGAAEAPVRDLTLRNLTWEHTEWSMPPSPQPADFQAAAWLPTA